MQLFSLEAKKFYVLLILCATLHANLNSNILLKSPKNLSATQVEELVKNWEKGSAQNHNFYNNGYRISRYQKNASQ